VKQQRQSLAGFDLPGQHMRNEAGGSPSLILLAKSNIAEMPHTVLLRYRLFLVFVRRRLTK
jgi:hypothetical protein